MTGSEIIDIVIGLIFFFLLYSLFATILQEVVATYFGFRSKLLQRAIKRMLEDGHSVSKYKITNTMRLFTSAKEDKTSMGKAFYDHPLIKYLGESKPGSKPSYLKSASFSKVVVDLLIGKDSKPGDDIQKKIQGAMDTGKTMWGNAKMPDETLDYLRSIWLDAEGDLKKFRLHLELWYDETMERASGWYKKHTQFILLIIGFILAICFNLDTIKVTKQLSTNPQLRAQIVQQADAFTRAHPNLKTELEQAKLDNEKLFKTDTGKNKINNNLVLANKYADSMNKETEKMRDSLLGQASHLVQNDIKNMNSVLAIGWKGFKLKHWWDAIFMFFGWLITAIAISLGAPFWFDLLNKFMKLRSSVTGGGDGKKEK